MTANMDNMQLLKQAMILDILYEKDLISFETVSDTLDALVVQSREQDNDTQDDEQSVG